MKILIFGPSGSGKTFFSNKLSKQGFNAFDADQIKGLSGWYDKNGQKIFNPKDLHQVFNNNYSFLWSRRVLRIFLSKYEHVLVFGGAGNIFDMIDLFDSTYFLKVDVKTQKERIQKSTERNSGFDSRNNELVIWGQWLEEEAIKMNIPFINGNLSPDEIYSIIYSGGQAS